MKIKESELILNPDGSIYHLNCTPKDIATTIITVGDPERVDTIVKYFDEIEVSIHKREFKTVTGTYKGKRLTIISTGIGTDNIDIVFNELDALANIDFETRTVKEKQTILTFIRIGTSGAIQKEIAVDSLLISEKAIGFDNLLHFYSNTDFCDLTFANEFVKHTNWNSKLSYPYVVSASKELLDTFATKDFIRGITATNVGFYGPQGRTLRLPTYDANLNDKIASFQFDNHKITNLEMETSGIYGMSKLLGHRAISLNAILANRANGTFSKNPEKTIDALIKTTLEIVADNEL